MMNTRRQPLTNAVNQPLPQRSPVKNNQVSVKPPSSPPLPRQNTKTTPPSPPRVIQDTSHAASYTRVGFLGEGGFARVFEVEDKAGSRLAIKVVTKTSLKTKKAKTKLYAEIKIHRSLQHPNIVRFGDCFEDPDNVYMTLELCQSGSLMDMLRHRRRFTEPETRFFLVQLIGACNYMHTHQVIHRDLKLGNLFLDEDMNIKVGDFGLAALIESPGERKKTICGTPNYIAPEVLFDTANGHSFEVDTWSIGVILYTLVVGRPPFQTKDVKTIYKRIRDNQYEFPPDRPISTDSQELIQQILTPVPTERPTLHEIVDHAFFVNGTVPAYIPRTAQDFAPDFRNITKTMSQVNLKRLREKALLDTQDVPGIAVPSAQSNLSVTSLKSKASGLNMSASTVTMATSMSSSIAQQEREFQRAVQPSSPISALLGAARQPLMMAPAGNGGNASSSGREREQPLIRKLQAAAKESRSPGRPLAQGGKLKAGLQDIAEEDADEVDEHELQRRKELEAQKARIVAQMVPGPDAPAPGGQLQQGGIKKHGDDLENMPPAISAEKKGKESGMATRPSAASMKISGFEPAAQTLVEAFEARAKGKVYKDPTEDMGLPDTSVFIVSWVDYCNKYGMGYALTDGSVGVHFNDSTSIVMSPDKQHFDYISSRRSGTAYARKNGTISNYPEELKSKVYLLKHFEKYIMERLYGEYPFTFNDVDRTKGMDFVSKYLRMKHVIVFQLSSDVLQFNFYDHTKVVLSHHAHRIIHISKDYEMTRWTLGEVMMKSIHPSEDPVEAKFNSRLVEKLKYCREVLLSIKTASGDLGSSKSSNGSD